MGKHAQERTQQRYNLELSYKDEKNILNMIKNGKGIPLDSPTEDENVSFIYVLYKNIPLKVLYAVHEDSGKVKGIVTVYPLDVDEYNEVMEEDFKNKVNLAKLFLEANGYKVERRELDV
jgi:hypothetical protein